MNGINSEAKCVPKYLVLIATYIAAISTATRIASTANIQPHPIYNIHNYGSHMTGHMIQSSVIFTHDTVITHDSTAAT